MGKLIVVPTPIGNLEDITLRAIRILKEVALILAEDTRVSRKLLSHYDIHTPMRSFHSHNEHIITNSIVEDLKQPINYALISDAGTPGISDPAYFLVKACLHNDIEVECLPGATAFVPAAVKSGLPTSSFIFEGFLPQKKGRSTRLKLLSEEERTMIFYESPHRILKCLKQFIETFGADRQASVSRELTKLHEETVNGSLEQIMQHFTKSTIKGEFVIVVSGKNK